jgi:hypothetical protein
VFFFMEVSSEASRVLDCGYTWHAYAAVAVGELSGSDLSNPE